MKKIEQELDPKMKQLVLNKKGEGYRGQNIMRDMPIWKALLRMMIPAIIFMFIVGAYLFMDNVLAINFAPDSYKPIGKISSVTVVRLSMASFGSINSLIIAFTMLFGLGISTRVAINRGRNDLTRAKNILKTGTMIGMMTSLILIPILLFTSKLWMRTQYPPQIADKISEIGYTYGWIIIMMLPFSMFNQIVSSMLRTEGRNKDFMIPYVISIALNLFLDWVFMVPGGMGIEGGAWATFISSIFVSLYFVVLMLKDKNSLIQFKHMFGLKFKLISIIGIVLVGISPFLRNIAQSISQTTNMNVIRTVSKYIYNTGNPLLDHSTMTSILTAVFPIFMLFFPMLFGIAQAGRPIASYNYGAGNVKRVKQVFWFSLLYSFIIAMIIYFLAAFLIAKPLMHVLGVTDPKTITRSITILKILLFQLPLFAIAISTMILLGSTDRIGLSLFFSSLRGIILFFPLIYIFKEIAINHPSEEFLFWWMYPVLAASTAIIGILISLFVLKHINKKVKTLDERLNVIYKKLSKDK